MTHAIKYKSKLFIKYNKYLRVYKILYLTYFYIGNL